MIRCGDDLEEIGYLEFSPWVKSNLSKLKIVPTGEVPKISELG